MKGNDYTSIVKRAEKEGLTPWQIAKRYRGEIIEEFTTNFNDFPDDCQDLRADIGKMLPYIVAHWPAQLQNLLPVWVEKTPSDSEMYLYLVSMMAQNYIQKEVSLLAEEYLQKLEMAIQRLAPTLETLATRYMRHVILIRLQMHQNGYYHLDHDWVLCHAPEMLMLLMDASEGPLYQMVAGRALTYMYMQQLDQAESQEHHHFLSDKLDQIMSYTAIYEAKAYVGKEIE